MAYESTQVNIRSFQLSDADRLDFALHLRDRPESRIKHPDWRSGDGLRSDLPFLTDPDQGFALVAEQDSVITGFDRLSFASTELLADASVERKGQKSVLTHRLMALNQPLNDVMFGFTPRFAASRGTVSLHRCR